MDWENKMCVVTVTTVEFTGCFDIAATSLIDSIQSRFWYDPIRCICDDSEQTRVLLTSAAYVHLKHAEVSKYTRNLAPASRTILLSGPAG
jgi:hypothetical protein